jgi:protease PrsW
MTSSKQDGSPQHEPDALISWWRVFLIGLALWIASVVVTGVTTNTTMIPTVVLLGSFLVPLTAVIWYLNRYHSRILSSRMVLYAFIVGGVLGMLAASLLEEWLLGDGLLAYLGVGLIEEFVKLVALLIFARGLSRYITRDGIVLSAAVGFGFVAFESSGYALTDLCEDC